MRFTRVKRDNDALMLEIDLYVMHTFNFHERRAQLSQRTMVIFAFGGDLDRFQNGVIGPFGIEWIGRVRIVWSCRIHGSFDFSCHDSATVVSGAPSS
jgi:hypothetical protein